MELKIIHTDRPKTNKAIYEDLFLVIGIHCNGQKHMIAHFFEKEDAEEVRDKLLEKREEIELLSEYKDVVVLQSSVEHRVDDDEEE